MKKVKLLIIPLLLLIFSIDVDASTTFTNGRVKYDYNRLIVRECANANCNEVKYNGKGIRLEYPDTFKVLGNTNGYTEIEFYYAGYIYKGYITSKYVDTTTYITDDNYKNNLINQGYPEDYAERLAILHAIHPNWTFTLSKTGDLNRGIDFMTAVNGEISKGVFNNLVDGDDTKLRSTAPGAYNASGWITTSGGWYAASSNAIAFFMDPRNFMDETFMFMFENLSYDSSLHTKEVVDKVTNNSFMKDGFDCNINSNNCPVGHHSYSESFIEAGKNKGLSPLSLAIRVLQEQGQTGSALSNGTGYEGQYIGYYNLFNIYANGDKVRDVVLNGLNYAYKQNWNNPMASILSGASLLGEKYIRVGQNTLYYQKYDTVGSYLLYEHQYMQNVRAPFNEGYNTYASYRRSYANGQTENIDEWNNSRFNFIIPIYDNMPRYTSLSEVTSGDNTLRSLNVTNCEIINPGFDPNALTYDCYVGNNIQSVNISAAATNSYAVVKGTGDIRIDNDNITREIIVTAANNSTRTYRINIHRIAEESKEETQNNNNTNLSSQDILKNIDLSVKDEFVSNFTVGNKLSDIINQIKKYTNDVITSNNNDIVKTGDIITLNNKTYTVIIYGDSNGDGKINTVDFAKMKQQISGSLKLNGASYKALDLNKDGKVNTTDFALIKKQILGNGNISQK